MEFYGLRKAGEDIDFIVTKDDYDQLAKQYPNNLKNIFGDKGVCVINFEIWKSIRWHVYEELIHNAIEENDYLVISLEKLLLLKALAMSIPKYHDDLELIVAKISKTKTEPKK
ncbi:MAG: hypothetical protein KGD59_13710 [Candidatus Heimdallarchaeota archaeon]|nr:hypothetical protein [Candidatus Heimdallarchaeota archaeon]MBY8995601.1 hypothetical protein [Candidatus Heimdallarchaeota archaeon]